MLLDLVLINVGLLALVALLPPRAGRPRQAGRRAAKAALRGASPDGTAGAGVRDFVAGWSEAFLCPRSLADVGKVAATAALATLLSGSAVAAAVDLAGGSDALRDVPAATVDEEPPGVPLG